VDVPGPVYLLIHALAVARLTLLVTSDRVFQTPRTSLVGALARRGHDLLAYLILCPWCVSVWIGIVAAPVIYLWGTTPWLTVPALALALSMVAGLLAAAKGD
jgi:hypothetical protein